MKKTTPSKLLACLWICMLGTSAIRNAHADDGTWTGPWNGLWSATTNWQNGTPADGVGATAIFTNNFDGTGVQLDGSITLGGMNFNGWSTIRSANSSTVRLDNGFAAPVIAVNSTWAFLNVSLQGDRGFVKEGSGWLHLQASNSYSGQTVVSSGSLTVEHASALGLGGEGNGTRIENGAHLSINTDILNESLTIADNGSLSANNYSKWGGNITLESDAVIFCSVSGNIALAGNTLTVGDAEISGGISGGGNLRVRYNTILSGSNSYTGTTDISQSTVDHTVLKLAGPSSLYGGNESSWTKEKVTVGSGAEIVLRVGGANDFTVTQAATVLNGLSVDINGNGLMIGSTFGIEVTNAAQTVTFNHVIGDSTGTGGGSIGFAKYGLGTLILNQANTYSGETVIHEGTLGLSGNGTLGNGTGLLDVGYLGELNLGGKTQNVGSVRSEGMIRNGTLVADNGYWVANADISANLQGSSGMTVAGGNVRLSGANSFSGNTTVNDGWLTLASKQALYGGDITQWASSTISVQQGAGLQVYGVTASEASGIYNQLRNSSGGAGLNAGAYISFDLAESGGDHDWVGALYDSYGDTGGRVTLNVYNTNGYLNLNQTGSFTGNASFNNVRFGANNASGTGAVFTWGVADLNGYDGTTRGGNANWVNYGNRDSKITFHVDPSDPDYYQNDSGGWTGLFNGTVGYDGAGGINLEKTGAGIGVFDGVLGASVKAIDVTSGKLILTTNSYQNVGSQYDGGNYIGSTATIRNGATLQVDGSLNSRVVVQSGALLGGHGSINEAVTVQSGGTLAPGASIGSLKIGNVTFSTNSTFNFEVDSSAALGVAADLLVIDGDLNLDLTQLIFNNIATEPSSFALGTSFSLMNYNGIWNGGTFVYGGNTLSNGEEFYAGNNYWRIDYDALLGGGNFTDDQWGSASRFVNLTATAIPEPTTYALLALGAVGMLIALRRNKAA